MKSTYLKVLFFLVFFFSLSFILQQNLYGEGEDYYPLRVGNTWTYIVEKGEEVKEERIVVSKRVKVGKVNCYLRENTDKERTSKMFCSKDKGGVYLRRMIGKAPIFGKWELEPNPPMIMLKYPLEVGKEWVWKGKIEMLKVPKLMEMTCKVLKKEKIKVPAGEFVCFKVQTERTGMGKGIIDYHWYAKGVGLIKSESETKKGRVIRVLKSYKLK